MVLILLGAAPQREISQMDYKTYPPSPELDALIKCYWTLEIPKEVPKGRQQVLSDGCMEIIFNLGDDVKRILPDATYLVQPRSFVLGQITKPMWVETIGKSGNVRRAISPRKLLVLCQNSYE